MVRETVQIIKNKSIEERFDMVKDGFEEVFELT